MRIKLDLCNPWLKLTLHAKYIPCLYSLLERSNLMIDWLNDRCISHYSNFAPLKNIKPFIWTKMNSVKATIWVWQRVISFPIYQCLYTSAPPPPKSPNSRYFYADSWNFHISVWMGRLSREKIYYTLQSFYLFFLAKLKCDGWQLLSSNMHLYCSSCDILYSEFNKKMLFVTSCRNECWDYLQKKNISR